MRTVFSYANYLALVNNTCDFENLLSIQKSLETLVHRDKSSLTNFQQVLKQLDDLLGYDVLNIMRFSLLSDDENKTVCQAKKEIEARMKMDAKKHFYYTIVSDWSNIIQHANIINQLLVLCFQYKDKIQYDTLKFSHKIQQSMSIEKISDYKDEFLSRLKSDLMLQSVDFSAFDQQVNISELTSQKPTKDNTGLETQDELKQKLKEEAKKQARLEAKFNAEQARLRAQLEEEAQKQAKLKQQLEEEQARLAELAKQPKPSPKKPLHVSMPTNQNDTMMECPTCNKQYQSYYTICLKDGSTLIPVTKNFNVK